MRLRHSVSHPGSGEWMERHGRQPLYKISSSLWTYLLTWIPSSRWLSGQTTGSPSFGGSEAEDRQLQRGQDACLLRAGHWNFIHRLIQSSSHSLILGQPSLFLHNPHIDWRTGKVRRWGTECAKTCITSVTQEEKATEINLFSANPATEPPVPPLPKGVCTPFRDLRGRP